MKEAPAILAAALLLSGAGVATSDEPADAAQVAIRMTINPEARLSVVLTGTPPRRPCGTVLQIPVRVLNQGYVTSRLQARLVGDAPGVTLNVQSAPLQGARRETRWLSLTLSEASIVDVTIAFSVHGESDLGGRDRIHLLMQCKE